MLAEFQKKIDYQFQNQALLESALVHRSFINECADKSLGHNERMEFLGDAVLELVVTEYLYNTYPNEPEGELTSWRSTLVKGERLAEVAGELAIGKYLKLSKGEEKSGGREKAYLLANAFEAIIGAIYLDTGFGSARDFIGKFILPRLEQIIADGQHVDAKSKFQELSQEKRSITPEYRVLAETGPDHAKEFEMGAFLSEQEVGRGKGGSKQSAEQSAAADALKKLEW